MNTTQINPIDVHFNLTHDCIRACVYADYINAKKPDGDAWKSICDMCYSDAVISWNCLFGANSQESHWKKLVAKVSLKPDSKLKLFSKEMIVDYLKTTEMEWEQYHSSMVTFRNSWLAHTNAENILKDIPNFTWAMKSAYLYRQWLLLLLLEYRAAGLKIHITKTTGKMMLATFRAQIAEVCK